MEVFDLNQCKFIDTNIIKLKPFYAYKETIYRGNELDFGWERLKYGIKGNSIAYWVSPTNVSVEFMKDVDDVREQLSIKSDKMLHFIFTFFTSNDSTWAVLVQRLFTRHVTDYIRKNLDYLTDIQIDGNDVFISGRKFSVSIAVPGSGFIKFHYGINVSDTGAPIPVSCLNYLYDEWAKANELCSNSKNPFELEKFIEGVLCNFIYELDDIFDDSQKAVF